MKINPDDTISPYKYPDRKDEGFGYSNVIPGRQSHGLTKREYFAAMALQGAMANSSLDCFERPDQLAYIAVARADALIAELNEE